MDGDSQILQSGVEGAPLHRKCGNNIVVHSEAHDGRQRAVLRRQTGDNVARRVPVSDSTRHTSSRMTSKDRDEKFIYSMHKNSDF